jgi:hypothetical protein
MHGQKNIKLYCINVGKRARSFDTNAIKLVKNGLQMDEETVGHGLLIHEVSRSHKTTHHSR